MGSRWGPWKAQRRTVVAHPPSLLPTMPAMAALAFKARVGLAPWASRPQRAWAVHPVRANILQRRSVFTARLIMLARWLTA
eukprot:2448811-Pyramimonas_sp.AAC.1